MEMETTDYYCQTKETRSLEQTFFEGKSRTNSKLNQCGD
jgi:hypothetical protein